MGSSEVRILISGGLCTITSGSYGRRIDAPGFDLDLSKHRKPARFYIMGGDLVHEREGVLRIVGPEMKIQMDRNFKPEDLVELAPPELKPATQDYANLFAANLQYLLTTVQSNTEKEWKTKVETLERQVSGYKRDIENRREEVEKLTNRLAEMPNYEITMQNLRRELNLLGGQNAIEAVKNLIEENKRIRSLYDDARRVILAAFTKE